MPFLTVCKSFIVTIATTFKHEYYLNECIRNNRHCIDTRVPYLLLCYQNYYCENAECLKLWIQTKTMQVIQTKISYITLSHLDENESDAWDTRFWILSMFEYVDAMWRTKSTFRRWCANMRSWEGMHRIIKWSEILQTSIGPWIPTKCCFKVNARKKRAVNNPLPALAFLYACGVLCLFNSHHEFAH